MTVAAAVLTAVAIAMWRPPGRWWVQRRLGSSPTEVPVGVLAMLAVAVGSVSLPLVPVRSGPGGLLALTVTGVGVFVGRQVRSSQVRREVELRRVQVAELLGLVAAELRSGVLPHRALSGLADDFACVSAAARAAELGGDVPDALRAAAAVEGQELLRDLAGAWHVAERAGAPLATVIDRLEQSARSDREIAREVASGVAPARATGRLMAVLPVLGLLLGSGMGGDPVAVLTTTWPGVGCLAVGCALACGGIAWVEHIAASVDDRR